MTRALSSLRWAGGWLLGLCLVAPCDLGLAAEPTVLQNSADFFPDDIGNSWTYQGRVTTAPIQRVAVKRFENTSTVTATDTIEGVEVKVFHDTNPGDHGPQDSFYRRDAAGIVYYGSRPGTDLERQVVPYQIVTFPIRYPSSFQQFDRKDLDFGADLDRDGVNERADLAARVTIKGLEPVTVPAGTYEDALRVEARMTIRIHLSKMDRVAEGRDTMTAWFARGVGLIKYVESQSLPGIRTDRDRSTEITEELVEVKLDVPVASLGRGEAPARGVLADRLGGHELRQVVLPPRLGAHP